MKRKKLSKTQKRFMKLMETPDWILYFKPNWIGEILYRIREILIQIIGYFVCLFYGHVVVDDHCGLPEHRYCVVCGLLRPNHPVSADIP